MTVRHVVLDTAFGDGARFAAARAAGHPQLHYLAITPRVAAAASILEPQLRGLWPPDLPGLHRIVLDDGRVTLDLLVGDVGAMLPQAVARVDHFHVDVADAAVARTLARLAAPGATLAATAPAEASVWALTAAGFACRLVDGGNDVAATYRGIRTPPLQPLPAAPPVRRAVVIGAGLAGAAACRRLCASGWNVTLIERHAMPAMEASGNLAGIFMPLLSRDDNIPTRLARAAYLFALREWQRLGGVGTAFTGAACGVLQLARDAGHARVQQAVLAAWDYPPGYVRWADAHEAGQLLGGPTPHGGWLFPQGGWARPSSLCAAMLDQCGARLTRVFHSAALTLDRAADGSDEWLVCGAEGALLARAPTVILANGAGAVAIEQAAQLPLHALRGQVTHLAVDAGAPQLPLVVCREAYVTPACDGIVCAGATYDDDGDPQLRLASQRENLERLAEIVPGPQVAALADKAPLAGRVGFRCAAPDRLPLAGALPDYPAAGRLEQLADVPRHAGLYGLLGYASRGLIWAPLMAELLVSQLDNTPPPLEASLVDALDPGRFLLKQRRRAQ